MWSLLNLERQVNTRTGVYIGKWRESETHYAGSVKIHKRVPRGALPSAIRIDLQSSSGCSCDEYCNGPGNAYWDGMEGVWINALHEYDYPWKVEIIDGSYGEERMSPLRRLALNLKVMISQPRDFARYFEGVISGSKDPLDPQLSMSVSGARNLGTLYLHMNPRDPLSPLIKSDMFPSLQYLGIHVIKTRRPLEQQEIHRFLRYIGSQLRTFYYHHHLGLYPTALDPSLWNLLPNVESIQLPFEWVASDVPKGHPLKRVQITAFDFPYHINDEVIWKSALSHYCPLSPQGKWCFGLNMTWTHLLTMTLDFSMCIWNYFEENDALLEDAHGDTLSQHIVFVIKAFWKQPHRKYHKSAFDG